MKRDWLTLKNLISLSGGTSSSRVPDPLKTAEEVRRYPNLSGKEIPTLDFHCRESDQKGLLLLISDQAGVQVISQSTYKPNGRDQVIDPETANDKPSYYQASRYNDGRNSNEGDVYLQEQMPVRAWRRIPFAHRYCSR